MELRIPTLEELRKVYYVYLEEAFPPAELKPLAAIEKMWKQGWYKPYCLFHEESFIGAAFLWLGHPGWSLLDYLCVAPAHRNVGFGAEILRMLSCTEPNSVIFWEAEAPARAPDPAMAERRLDFYCRNGGRIANYDTEIFGVHYKTLYLAEHTINEAILQEEHRFVYENSFTPEKFAKFVRIPYDPTDEPSRKVAWDQ